MGHLEDKVEQGKYSREQADSLMGISSLDAHLWITPVPRFHQCLKVLSKMFERELPTIVTVRLTTCQVVVYGFVDASGSGFGSTLLVKRNIEYRIGTW